MTDRKAVWIPLMLAVLLTSVCAVLELRDYHDRLDAKKQFPACEYAPNRWIIPGARGFTRSIFLYGGSSNAVLWIDVDKYGTMYLRADGGSTVVMRDGKWQSITP